LLAEICSRGIASALEALNSVPSSSGTPAQRLEQISRRFVTAVLQSQRHIAIFAREEKNLTADAFRQIADMRREFDTKLVGLLKEGVAAGEFHISDAHIAALAIGGMVSWAYVWYRPGGRLGQEAIAEEMTQLVLGVVGATAGSAPNGKAARTVALRPKTAPRDEPAAPARSRKGKRS
jgi:hypothetical protein